MINLITTMNDASNSSQPENQGQSQQAEGGSCSEQSARCVFEPLRSAFGEGAHRAQAAAEKTIPKVIAAASSATYWLGFGVSFASIFSYTILTELTPEVLKAGCRDGAQAGRKKAENLASKARSSTSAASAAAAPVPEPGSA